MLNDTLRSFCQGWIDKAQPYNVEETSECFDKFFTLFVAYNALYAEVARQLIDDNQIRSNEDTDRASATKHVPRYYGYKKLAECLKNDPTTKTAIDTFVKLVEEKRFYFNSKKSSVELNHKDDMRFIRKIKNGTDQEFCESVLVFLYLARCNMFHGSKEFHQHQKNVLKPMIVILNKLVLALFEELQRDARVAA